MSDTPQRIAVVTGASRGIGRAIALRLARPTPVGSGRHVVLVARSESGLNTVRDEIVAAGGQASVRVADLADGAAFAGVIEKIAEEFGRLDVLVNNAGITKDNLILRMSDAEFDDVIAVNLRSAFLACRAAARPMMKGRFGRIINIASTSGLVGNAGQANYAAAKSGLIGLTKSIAKELGGKGVTANVIAPGFIKSDMTANLPQQVIDAVKAMMAVKDLGEPEDIAACVDYVQSDDAKYLTGQVIAVDGGMTMW